MPQLSLKLEFEQVLELVQQLSPEEKTKLSEALEKDTLNQKLTNFLTAFKNDEISLDIINEEVETVRAEIYEKQQTL
ncbi:type II toxin-antitoxin system VapB15 family antitoxin [Geminocystis sp. CENA526]|uniref:type II toxin-antitoxin system VapB15 family antitoxin n=1 Tax=Geminocystis sp. CENA526 TaxID=1355871 RepID=UPI003D6EC8FC